MKQEMTRCDNPSCGEVTDETYGWITGKLTINGHGPTVTIEVCSTGCLEEGFDSAVERQQYEEEVEARTWEALVEEKTMSIKCPVCTSGPGQVCITRPGNTAQRPHASRRDEGRRLAVEERKES